VIEPIINPLLAFLILGELMTGKAIFGGFLVLIGVVGRGLIKSNKAEYF
jgi:drug/metabolite transporter (DMT)-like permease